LENSTAIKSPSTNETEVEKKGFRRRIKVDGKKIWSSIIHFVSGPPELETERAWVHAGEG
jgi:hypothetical protein